MRKEKIIVADRYMTLKSVKPKKDCNVCDYINDYVCFDHEHQQIKNENHICLKNVFVSNVSSQHIVYLVWTRVLQKS